MSKKIKIILFCVGLLSLAGAIVLVFLYYNQIGQLQQDTAGSVDNANSTQSVSAPALGEIKNDVINNPGTSEVICGRESIKNTKPIEDGKIYVTRVSGADQNSVAYYNDYLLCKMFITEKTASIAEDFIGTENNFSQSSFAENFFTEFSSWGAIFKSSDCGSVEVSNAVSNMKKAVLSPAENSAPADLSNDINIKFSNNLRNVSSADLCGFFKRNADTIAKFEKEDFCAGDLYCQATIKDDINVCAGLASEDDKKSCRDNTWYQRALRSNNIATCANVESSQQNIACQAYFLNQFSNMCDGLINTINDKFCK